MPEREVRRESGFFRDCQRLAPPRSEKSRALARTVIELATADKLPWPGDPSTILPGRGGVDIWAWGHSVPEAHLVVWYDCNPDLLVLHRVSRAGQVPR